ncbi:MAG: TVP38/TMEM64 family protein [Candidatus Acidoferrales bacterium]
MRAGSPRAPGRQEVSPKSDMSRRRSLKTLAVVATVALLMGLSYFLPLGIWLERFAGWVSAAGVVGLVVFALVYVLATILFGPGSILTLAAGALFGVLWGTVVVSLASTVGAAIAFLIGRYLARARVERWAREHPRFSALDAALKREGIRIVLLTRLSPLFPYNLVNYLLGLTAIRFWPQLLASWVGMLPGTLLYVYLGFAGRAAVQAASGTGGFSVWQYVSWGVGLAATTLLAYYLSRLARRALAAKTN